MLAETNTNKLDLFKKARSKIEGIDKATAFLEKYQLIVPGAVPSHNALVTGLLHFTTSGPGGALATEGLVAFAHYADAVQHEEVSTNLMEATMRKLQLLWTSLELTREDLEVQAMSTHELVSKIQETVAQTEECCKTAMSVGVSRTATASHPHTGESLMTARPLTYATAVQHTLPTMHASAIDREEVRA
ncbi:hypothetical protein A0H81_14887 [Grifola frondosa]|uniref:Uncharacterized protein n=1 Tax=Grifola frondosa TaxID=5627 RepID=A0A1C7LLQ9_GRIFR|nr:hypothetical protein A0H81_14887 [Grifola frondosa]